MTKTLDISWLSGLLEGEGCFYYGDSPSIKVMMTDRDTIEKVAHLLKMPVSEQKKYSNYKQVYIVSIHGDRAIGWMFTLYSLMGKRRQAKIKEVLDKWKDKVRKQGNIDSFICGHLKSQENTYWSGRYRVCRQCSIERKRVKVL